MNKNDLYKVLQRLQEACPEVLFINTFGGGYRYGPFFPKYKCVYCIGRSGQRKDIIMEGDEILLPMVDVKDTKQVEADLLDLLAEALTNYPNSRIALLTSFTYNDQTMGSYEMIHFRACSVVFEETSLGAKEKG